MSGAKNHRGQFRDRICVTNWRETPDDDVNLVRARPKIFEGWGRLDQISTTRGRSRFSSDFGQYDPLKWPSHQITIRNPSDVFITSRHWVFAWRRYDQRQWFRILEVQTNDRYEEYIDLRCLIDEIKDPRADPAIMPINDKFEEPRPEPTISLGPKYGSY